MAFEIIAIADNCAMKVGKLVENQASGDKLWTNEFCRALHVIERVLKGSYNLILEIEANKTGGMEPDKYVISSSLTLTNSYLPAEFLALPRPYKAGLVLTDPEDPRYRHAAAFFQRVGQTLHLAASATRNVGESDNSVESVKSLVATIGTFLTTYGIKPKQLSSTSAAYAGMQANKRMYDSQRKYHRSLFMVAATIHHQNRLSSVNFWRTRSDLDDRLIRNMLDFCLSPFTRIRRSAQGQLESITRTYRGNAVLCLPTLFDNLQPGTDPDRMKGALYVLRYNAVGLVHLGRKWTPGGLVRIVELLLNAHHENKASIQALVTKSLEELLAVIKQPTTSQIKYRLEDVDKAADSLVEAIRFKPDSALIERLHNSLLEVKTVQDEQWDILVDRVIAIASEPQLNWRYVQAASRILLHVARRDRPVDVRMAKFHAQSLLNPLPRLRDYAVQ